MNTFRLLAFALALIASPALAQSQVNLNTQVKGTLPVANGGTGSASAPSNGQVLIGNGSGYSLATLTAGSNVTITNGSGSVTIASTGGGGGGGSTTIVAPQGRLTLVSATPVMTSDQTAKSQVYYPCYTGSGVPYYNGSIDQMDTIASCQVSLTMQTSGTGVTNSGGVFDIFWVHGGTNRICVATNGSGGGWASDTGGSNTARGTGYSQVHNTRGYWTNVNSITHCYNGTTDYGSISADQGTYLGSVYTTAAGQTGMAFKPAAANGGTANILGLYNAYNRVRIQSSSSDTSGGADYTYNSTTWRAANANNNNRISWIDGLQQSSVGVSNSQGIYNNPVGATGIGALGTSLDSTSTAPAVTCTGGASIASGTVLSVSSCVAVDIFQPQIGFHFAQRMEVSSTGTASFAGSATSPTRQNNSFTLTLEM